jgi:hypothetical protein
MPFDLSSFLEWFRNISPQAVHSGFGRVLDDINLWLFLLFSYTFIVEVSIVLLNRALSDVFLDIN